MFMHFDDKPSNSFLYQRTFQQKLLKTKTFLKARQKNRDFKVNSKNGRQQQQLGVSCLN